MGFYIEYYFPDKNIKIYTNSMSGHSLKHTNQHLLTLNQVQQIMLCPTFEAKKELKEHFKHENRISNNTEQSR